MRLFKSAFLSLMIPVVFGIISFIFSGEDDRINGKGESDNLIIHTKGEYVSEIKNSVMPEICNNGVDDDGDGLIDCADPDCPENESIEDNCATTVFSNNNGSFDFATDWIESEGDGPQLGNLTMNGTHMYYDGNGGAITMDRELNLGYASSATLSYNYSEVGTHEGNDCTTVFASSDGGSNYTQIAQHCDDGSGSQSIDISAYISSNTRIRFEFVTNSTAEDRRIDGVKIDFGYTGPNISSTNKTNRSCPSPDGTIEFISDCSFDNLEFSVDDGVNWTSSNPVGGLDTGVLYIALARIVGNTNSVFIESFELEGDPHMCGDQDNDGVDNGADLDDDNDGILDAEEESLCEPVDYKFLKNKQKLSISATAQTSGDINVLLDSLPDNNSFFYPDVPIAGKELFRIDFNKPVVLTGVEYEIGNSYMFNTGATTKFQGSNDETTWTDVSPEYTKVRPPNNAPGVLSTAPHAETFLWSNTSAYRFYRHYGVSGNTNQNPWINELHFRTEKIKPCDLDGDGLLNRFDLDTDNDGIPDNVEAQGTFAYVPPNPDNAGTYLSNNGVNSAYLGGLTPEDTDADGSPDFCDNNSDNHLGTDQEESGLTFNDFPGANGLDSGSETIDDYSDVNGIVNDPPNDLASETPGVTECDYRRIAPAIPIKVCYKSQPNNFVIGGAQRTFADDKLLNADNFGTFAPSNFEFTLYNFGTNTITLSELNAQGCQIFDLGINNGDAGSGTSHTSYSQPEEDDLKTWSNASPANIILGFQGYAEHMTGAGFVATGSGNNNPNTLTSLGEKVVNGPFGDVLPFNQGGSYQGTFSTIPGSACVITVDATDDPTGVIENNSGDFFLADCGMVAENGGLTNNDGITSNTDIFFANLYHSLATLVVANSGSACGLFSCPKAGGDAPILSTTTIQGPPPVDLTSVTASNLPSGITLTWHTATPANNGNKIANPSAYPNTGSVYACFYDPVEDCYGGDGTLTTEAVITSPELADIEITVTPSTQSANKGETVSYTVTITNNGPEDATNLIVAVPMPDGKATLVTHSASAGTYNVVTNLWSIPSLLNTNSANFQFTCSID